jgi:hypothetical protein
MKEQRGLMGAILDLVKHERTVAYEVLSKFVRPSDRNTSHGPKQSLP